MAAFPFTVNPDAPLETMIQPRKKTASFGDGYIAEAPDGINTMLYKDVVFTWSQLTATQKDTIVNFFKSTRGVDKFTMALQPENITYNWKVTEWSELRTQTNWTVRATLNQVP